MTDVLHTIPLIRTKLQRPRLPEDLLRHIREFVESALVGTINHLNALGAPLISVECLPKETVID